MAVKSPVDLGPAGKKLWREIVAKMADLGWQPDARERKVLHSAAALADVEAALREVVRTEPLMTTGSRGQVVMHPAVAELRAVAHEIAALLLKIDMEPNEGAGLSITLATPAARAVKARDAANARWRKHG
jgi:hypothetical protein